METISETSLLRVQTALGAVPGVEYALLFGSMARGTAHPTSDIDIAVSGVDSQDEASGLALNLERILGREVQVVRIPSAPIALRFRIFRDGRLLFERDRAARVRDQARAIVEYLDFRPVEEACTRGVLDRPGRTERAR